MFTYDDYKLATPPDDEFDYDYWQELSSYHECVICQESFHEEAFYRTDKGWCCIDCYDYLHTECSDEPDLPKIIEY